MLDSSTSAAFWQLNIFENTYWRKYTIDVLLSDLPLRYLGGVLLIFYGGVLVHLIESWQPEHPNFRS